MSSPETCTTTRTGIVLKRLGFSDQASDALSLAIRRAPLALERMDVVADARRWVSETGTVAMAEVIAQAEELLAKIA
jgi:hypothetical protein